MQLKRKIDMFRFTCKLLRFNARLPVHWEGRRRLEKYFRSEQLRQVTHSLSFFLYPDCVNFLISDAHQQHLHLCRNLIQLLDIDLVRLCRCSQIQLNIFPAKTNDFFANVHMNKELSNWGCSRAATLATYVVALRQGPIPLFLVTSFALRCRRLDQVRRAWSRCFKSADDVIFSTPV